MGGRTPPSLEHANDAQRIDVDDDEPTLRHVDDVQARIGRIEPHLRRKRGDTLQIRDRTDIDCDGKRDAAYGKRENRVVGRGLGAECKCDALVFETAADRDATAQEFGEDVVARIEEQRAGTLEPCIKEWLAQRLSLLGAKTAEPYVKGGVILVPPRS